MVTRASNRIFVGVPLCGLSVHWVRLPHFLHDHLYTGRNEDWLSLNIDAAVETMKVAAFINLFPRFLRPYGKINCRPFAHEAYRFLQDCRAARFTGGKKSTGGCEASGTVYRGETRLA